MKRWNLVVALGVLLGLSAYVYFVEIKGGEKKQQAKEESEKVLSFKKDQISGITLSRGFERIRIEKVAGSWRIQEPLQTIPDGDAVERLLDSLLGMRRSHDLGRSKDPAAFNLQNPPLTVEISASTPGPFPPLAVGDDAPTGGGAYVRLGPDGKIQIVTGVEELRGATLFSLRDKTFFKFDPSKVLGLALVREKDEVALEKKAGKWSLISPLTAPMEASTLSDLITALERLTVTEFVDERPAADLLAKRGLRPPRFRVKLRGEEWKNNPELLFGSSEGGSLHALHPASHALVKVSDGVEAKLKSSPADLRRKDLMPYPRWDLSRFRITGLLPHPLEVRRKGDQEWDRVSPAPGVLPDDPVDLLLRNLTDLKAEDFLDHPSPRLDGYGLEPPAARLEFWKQGGESPGSSTLLLGKADGRGRVYMKDEEFPSVLLVQEEVWKRAVAQILKVAEEKPKTEASPQAAQAPQTAPASK